MQQSSKPKGIILTWAEDQVEKYNKILPTQGAFELADIHIMSVASFNATPFPDPENVTFLGLDIAKLPLIEQLLDNHPNIKWIHIFWTGVNSFNVDKIMKHPAVMTNAKGVSAPGLSEMVVFGMMWFAKNATLFLKQKEEKYWKKQNSLWLRDMTLGTIFRLNIFPSIFPLYFFPIEKNPLTSI